MALQSQLFRGDAKLEAAAVSDPAHVTPGARGEHVGKIQQALIQLDGAAIQQDSAYGPATAAAVGAFKSKRQILNFEGRIDNIVGKKTIAALDAEMLAKEKGGAIGGVPGVPGGAAGGGRRLGITGDSPGGSTASGVIVEPFTRSPSNPMILTAVLDNPGKSDLNASDPEVPRLTFRERTELSLALSTILLGGVSVNLLESLMEAELFATAQLLGQEMFVKFKRNTTPGLPIIFTQSTPLGAAVALNPGFLAAAQNLDGEFDRIIKKQFDSGRINVNALEATTRGTTDNGQVTFTNPAGITTSPIVGLSGSLELAAVIGGAFQAGTVALKTFTTRTPVPPLLAYDATLTYTLTDHFGVDNSDVVFDGFHGTPGQKSFWLLQHRHPPGHKPFRTVVVLERKIGRTLN